MIRRLVLINAVPGAVLQEGEGQERPAGYYQRFGVTGTTEEEILAVIRDYLRKDLASKIIEVENQGEPDFENLDAEIRGRVGNVQNPGIWYVSGRAFYMKKDGGSRRSGGADIQVH